MGVLVTGLIISVTLMAVAASALASLIKKHRWIAWVGLLMVLYVALSMVWHGGTEVMAAVAARKLAGCRCGSLPSSRGF
jgi:predicted tellurium resistance membrane protein TerC